MPSYSYSAPSHYRLPPTPPEDGISSYTTANMSALHYQQNAFQAPMGVRRQEDRGFDYTERYGHVAQPHQQVPSTMMYPPHIYYSNPPAPMAPNGQTNGFYQQMPRPILPPPRGYQQGHAALVDQNQSIGHLPRAHQDPAPKEPKDDRPVGGVSAKLDYDMESMTDFVSETAQAMYDLLYSNSICLADIDIAASVTPTRPTPSGFRKWVHQVLSATRLPSSTILLAFEYLSEHMRNMQTHRLVDGNEAELHRIVTTALILGSKFLDDNTFINRSWAEVSGIDVATLNYLERSWLKEISFNLHRDPTAPHGFNSFLARWRNFEMVRKTARAARANPTPINTNVAMTNPAPHVYSPAVAQGYVQRSPPQAFGSKPMQSAYGTPYNRFYPYGPPRAMEASPQSAPHTSPTTPETYGAQWGSLNGTLGFNRVPTTSFPQTTQSMHAVAPPQFAMAYPGSSHSSNHGPDCFCMDCNRRYMMVPGFGVPVVG